MTSSCDALACAGHPPNGGNRAEYQNNFGRSCRPTPMESMPAWCGSGKTVGPTSSTNSDISLNHGRQWTALCSPSIWAGIRAAQMQTFGSESSWTNLASVQQKSCGHSTDPTRFQLYASSMTARRRHPLDRCIHCQNTGAPLPRQ